ncbi:MAG: OmpA family protein [Phycisphaerales bacterium]|nr:OmpA family protein [Phycisphaerales bacterium]
MADDHKEQHGDGGHGGGHGEHKPHKKHAHGHGAHEEHEEGVPEWVVSFADNVLLQMGFFVILLAMNLGVKAKGPTDDGDKTSAKAQDAALIDFAIAVREAFNSPVDLSSTKPEDLPLIKRIFEKRAELEGQGQSPEKGVTGDDKSSQSIRTSDMRTPAAYVDFDDRSSELTAPARDAISDVAKKLVGTRWIVEVRGHSSRLESTRDVGESRALSYQRAFAVAQALVEKGVDWRQIRVVAMGDSDLPTPRARSAQEHQGNQRVEVIQMPETLPPDPFKTSSSDQPKP